MPKPLKYNQAVIDKALRMIKESAITDRSTKSFCHADAAGTFAQLKIANDHREHFLVMYLNSQHQLIEDRIEFSGTINAASVYPRVIVKNALDLGAAAIIVAHNHPSGKTEPSQSDIQITERIKACVELIDISLLDHFIVSKTEKTSFLQAGLL
jgi:DNA repair protein RadC